MLASNTSGAPICRLADAWSRQCRFAPCIYTPRRSQRDGADELTRSVVVRDHSFREHARRVCADVYFFIELVPIIVIFVGLAPYPDHAY